ncbi:DUF928 domain-containing protein [Leptolyngbya sp. NK1-12]|uniref:DUF928 domain-containing protein n=1 Tax=Leptolyngbya sp. NK1-12 TaxID=2547451 RepID=A0AA96WBX5_9CYAN|nr:DUF928 domain-containing protein [Leptolyngbya sp. NK1-12]WNZ23512.1 DUF928 domain-containing protein [Leptolyngbya sp. NK1-12]
MNHSNFKALLVYWRYWLHHRFAILFLLLCVAGSVPALASLSLAQEFEPPDRGLPGRREGGGTRGECLVQQPALTALMPNTNLGLTVAEHPSFFWYIPQNGAAAGEFVLLDQTNAEVYKTIVPVSQAGVVSVSLPADGSVPALEVGQSYRWYFSLICDPLDRSADVFTSGWIKRVEPSPSLTQKLAAATAEEQPKIYAEAGIWYEALSTLVQLRQAQPQNPALVSQWQTLLASVGLEQIADQPLQ